MSLLEVFLPAPGGALRPHEERISSTYPPLSYGARHDGLVRLPAGGFLEREMLALDPVVRRTAGLTSAQQAATA